MNAKQLKDIINSLPDDMDVNVCSPYDGSYTEEAKADIQEYADGRKYLLVHS